MSILKANRIENLTTTDGGINVNNSGNVGIGTSSPVTQLHIQKATGGLAGVQISSSTYGSTLTDGLFVGIDDSNTYLYNYENTPLTFGTNSTERLRIDSSGNVGIGTSSPHSNSGTNLHIHGSNTTAELRLTNTTTGTGANGSVIQQGGNTLYISNSEAGNIAFENNGSERIRIDSSGKVGIGTQSPAERLHVAGDIRIEDTSPRFGFHDSNASSLSDVSGGFETFDSSGNRSCFVGSIGVNGAIAVGTNNAERMRIDSDGRLLLGSTASIGGNAIFQVQGSGNRKAHFHQPDSGGSIIQFTNTTTGTGTSDGFEIALNGSEDGQVWLYESGNIKFGTANSERMRLTNNGLTFNGDTAATNALDDYEEGTFAPTVTGSTTAGTATYAAQRGKYTKIGDRVFFEIYVAWGSGTGSGSQLYVSGLPFTVQTSNATYPAVTIGYWDSVTHGASSSPAALLASGNNYVYFYSIPNGGGGNSAIGYDASGSIILSGHYKVN